MSYKMDARHSESRLVTDGTGWAFTNYDNKRQGSFIRIMTKGKADALRANVKTKLYNVNTTTKQKEQMMPYYRVRVNRYTTNIQSYYVNVNTDCPEHAKEMAAEVLEAHLEGEDHELASFKPEAFGDNDLIEEEFEVDMTSEPDLCEYTEDLFIE